MIPSEWLHFEIRQLIAFVEYWEEMNAEDFEEFPIEMDEWDWEEKYRAWVETL